MKYLPNIHLIWLCCWAVWAGAQTPYDSFAPEMSRPILDKDSVDAWRKEQQMLREQEQLQHQQEILTRLQREPLLVAFDLQQQMCYLLDTAMQVLAYTPIPEDVQRWLSVDPLADQYIHQSPYLYCNGNPVMFIDPDGRDDFEVDLQSQRITQRENLNADHFYIIDANGERIDTGLDFHRGTFSTEDLLNNGALIKSENGFAVEQVFEYFSQNTDVEWREALYGSDQNSYVGTSFLEQSNSIGKILRGRGLFFLCHSHSHPGGTTTDDRSNRQEAQRWIDAFNGYSVPNFYIYANGEYYEYTPVPDMTKILLENMLFEIPVLPVKSSR